MVARFECQITVMHTYLSECVGGEVGEGLARVLTVFILQRTRILRNGQILHVYNQQQ